jgi:uncharacterized membrane protein
MEEVPAARRRTSEPVAARVVSGAGRQSHSQRINATQEGTMSSVMHTPAATYHVVMLSFEGEDQAGTILRRVRADGALEGCEITADAVVSRDSAGHIHVRERGAAGIGAAFGAVTAGLLGFLPGPMLLPILIVVGAVAGGVAGHFAGQVLPKEDLREVAASLPRGSSAYVAVVDSAHAEPLAAAFAAHGARVLNVAVETEMSSVIREAITGHVHRA